MLMVVARSHHRRLLAVVTMAVAAAAPGAVRARQAADIPVVRLEAVRDAQTNQPRSLPVTRLDDGQQSTDLDATRAVSLTFATPLSVRDVLLLLFRGTPFSVVFEPGI